jgi:hypothetical protein
MPNYSGMWSLSQQFQGRGQGLWPQLPSAPTIGTATAGPSNCASVAFTAPACGVPTTFTYTATSTPGCITATGTSSPVTVSGLTNGTSYTFKVKATTGAGTGPCSAASNSITAVLLTCATYTTAGTYSWVAPAGVTSVAAVAVGGGGRGATGYSQIYCCCGTTMYLRASGSGGGAGALTYRNGVSVTPGTSYTVVVGGQATSSSVFSMTAGGGTNATGPNCDNSGGTPSGTYTAGFTGGAGRSSAVDSSCSCTGYYYGGGGGGGAAGYAANGPCGGPYSNCGVAGTGGAGGGGAGGGSGPTYRGGGGGGVGIFGQGSNGTAGVYAAGAGGGGSGGTSGGSGFGTPIGGAYGGGGGGGRCGSGGSGSVGAVRIVWAGAGRGTPSFPSTNVGA